MHNGDCERAWDKRAPQSLRHSFATILVGNDIPIVEVQALMGHSDIKTTMIYVKVVQKKAMESQVRVMEGVKFG